MDISNGSFATMHAYIPQGIMLTFLILPYKWPCLLQLVLLGAGPSTNGAMGDGGIPNFTDYGLLLGNVGNVGLITVPKVADDGSGALLGTLGPRAYEFGGTIAPL